MHLVRRVAPHLAVLALVGLVLLVHRASLDPEMEARNAELQAQRDQVSAQNRRLKQEIAVRQDELRRLREDPGESLYHARTELGMIRPGEVVYQFARGEGGESHAPDTPPVKAP